MASLAEIRQQYPQYGDLSDDQLADSLHTKFYADMPRDQFNARVGYSPAQGMDIGNTQMVTPDRAPTQITVRPPMAEVAGTSAPVATPPSSLRVGAQGVGAGIAHTVGAPVDLMAGALNLGINGANAAFGSNIAPIREPFGGSESISNAASRASSFFGAPPVPESAMSPEQKLGYKISDYGTQFALPGAGLAARAGALATQTQPAGTLAGRVADTLSRPYAEAPVRTAVGDVAAGTGAGAAVNALDSVVDKNSPWRPLADMGGVLAGGSSGAGIIGLAAGLGAMIRSMAKNRMTDTNVPVSPTTGAPFTQAETERAATSMQAAATNPTTAAQNIRENSQALSAPTQPGELPVSAGEMPTSGLLSRDPGLVTAEAGARTRGGPPFVERDQGVKEAAASRVAGLRDPNADITAPRAVAQTEADTRIGQAQDAARTTLDKTRAGVDAIVADARDAATRAVQTAQSELEAGVAGAQTRLAAAEQSLREVEAQMQQQGAPIAARANADQKAQASQRLDRTLVDENYVPARTEKNRQFDTAPGRTEQLPADDVIAAARRVQQGINDLAPGGLQMPGEFVARLRALEPRMAEAEGPVAPGGAAPQVNVGGPGTALGGDLADLRKYLGRAYETAERSGNFDLADNIAALRRAINNTLTDAPGYTEANANYRQFADRFRPSPNDEGAKFTRQVDRDNARGTTPPSETAGRFLAGPEKTQALQRMLDGSPNGTAAVRDYLLSDFGMAALNPNGSINPNRAAAWGRNNADVLAQFPALRGEFDGMLATARSGEELSAGARQSIEQAQQGLSEAQRSGTRNLSDVSAWANKSVADTERAGNRTVGEVERTGQQRIRDMENDVARSAAGTLLREDPRDVAQRILGGKSYGADKEVAEINKLVATDPAAKQGWKAAVAEVLTDRVQSTRKTGEAYEIQYQRLAKEFKDNEQVLASVFSPEEMNTLQQAHTLLGYFKEAEKRATVGSNTADKMMIPGWLQLATRHLYGDLRGGGIIKRFKLLMDVLPSNRSAAEEVANMAWFNPDVAAYLLEKKLPNNAYAPYNVNLKRLEALAAGGRDSTQPDAASP